MPPFDIRQRTFEFACAIVRFYQYLLQETSTPRRLADQVLSSGTAIGAQLEEAEAAHSHADFVAKNSIALKEARETLYWLRLLEGSNLASASKIREHLSEAEELVRIITAIRRNSGHRRSTGA